MSAPADWRTAHAAKICTAEQAVGRIESGQTMATGFDEPYSLLEALSRRTDVRDVTCVIGDSTYGGALLLVEDEQEGRFRVVCGMIGLLTAYPLREGRIELMPVHFSDGARMYRRGEVTADVGLIRCSPPNAEGYCSLGFILGYTPTMVDVLRAQGKPIIAEVNDQMPFTLGDTLVHVDDLTALVPVSQPPFDLPPADSTRAEDDRIAEHVLELVPDGATVQVGIGNLPNRIAARLSARTDLGIHSEAFSDGLMQLMQSGVVTNAAKGHNTGKTVVNFALGSAALYAYIQDNPTIEFQSAERMLDPVEIGRNRRMIAINSALEVDLTGQVNAETIGGHQMSGVGGQVDFMRGATLSEGGRGIIALTSTTRHGTVSRIVSTLAPGAVVTTSRYDVHTVVTEFGAATLRGRTTAERAAALIRIAHPDYRDQLRAQAREAGLVQ